VWWGLIAVVVGRDAQDERNAFCGIWLEVYEERFSLSILSIGIAGNKSPVCSQKSDKSHALVIWRDRFAIKKCGFRHPTVAKPWSKRPIFVAAR